MVMKKEIKKEKKTTNGKSRNHTIKNIADSDWGAFEQLKSWHNKEFPDKKMTFRKFFKLVNTYSPLIQSLMQLPPDDSPLQRIGVHTAIGLAPMWVKNIGNNVNRIKAEKDIRELFGKYKDKNALIVGAGPSIYDNASGTNQLDIIQKYQEDFDGIIIVVDRMLSECLKRGIGAYFTVVDGSDKITPFFDNDEVRNFNERNDPEVGNLKSKILPEKSYNMKGIMATCAHPTVVDSWDGEIYFFVPTIPQEILPNASSLMCDFTGNSELNAGGNCGMLGWSLAMWMGCRNVALCGIDYSYKLTDDLTKTSNWSQFVRNTTPEEAMKNYKKGYNPDFKVPYLIDDVYAAFRTACFNYFAEYKKHERFTFNCTEGGALHHESITPMLLEDFLKSHSKENHD